MRPDGVEAQTKRRCQHMGVRDCDEPVFAEKLFPHFSIEAFDMRVPRRLGRIDEDELHAMLIRPRGQRQATNGRAVVEEDLSLRAPVRI